MPLLENDPPISAHARLSGWGPCNADAVARNEQVTQALHIYSQTVVTGPLRFLLFRDAAQACSGQRWRWSLAAHLGLYTGMIEGFSSVNQRY